MSTHIALTEREARRRLAARLLSEGMTCAKVAELVGAGERSVKRWKAAWKKGGLKALAEKKHSGRPPRLSPSQQRQVVKILVAGPLKSGYATDLWSCPRVAEVIERRFHVRYDSGHLSRLLHKWGWSCQKPERRARERNEVAIRRWRKHDWPRIKKGRAAES